jgi:hypothetical protein
MLSVQHANWIRRMVPVLIVCAFTQTTRAQGEQFVRGDLNSDGQVSWADVAFFTNWSLFPNESPSPLCLESADTFNDGLIEVQSVQANDLFYLMDFLLLTETPPTDNFPTPDVDFDQDQILCNDDSVTPPGGPDPAFGMSWETPGVLARGQKDVSFFLRVTSEEPEGFSAAFLVNRNVLNNIRVDFQNTVFPQNLTQNFEASNLFRVELIPTQDGTFDLLLITAVFILENPLQRILLGNLSDQPIIRLLADIKDDADEGDSVTILQPAEDHLSAGQAGIRHGIRNEFFLDDLVDPAAEPEDVMTLTIPIFDPGTILRGDSNRDREVDLSDPIHTLNYLFIGGPRPPCLDEADSNKDRVLDLSDGVFTLSYLFLGGPQPADWPGESALESGIRCGNDHQEGRLEPDCGSRCLIVDSSSH